jgi:hypothetical protein
MVPHLRYLEMHLRNPRKTTEGLACLMVVYLTMISWREAHAEVPARLVELLYELHAQQWNAISQRNFQHVEGVPFRPVMGSPAVENCGSEYLEHRSDTSVLRLRFARRGGECPEMLDLVSLTTQLKSRSDAELLRSSAIVQLRAGGIPMTEDGKFTFKWRSRDSRERYDLTASLRARGTNTEVVITLRHEPVEPDSVDYLPFERGFMGCDSARPDSGVKERMPKE